MALKLNAEKFETAMIDLKKVVNEGILEIVTDAITCVKNLGDENNVLEQYMQSALNFQGTYNSYLDGVDKLLSETESIFEISLHSQKVQIKDVKQADASFDVSAIDTSAFTI